MSTEAARETAAGGTVGHVVRRGMPLLALALVIVAVWLYWRSADDGPGHVAAAGPAGPVQVRVVTVAPETVPVRMRFLGQTEASQLVEIRARVAGYLEARSFEEGEVVEKQQQLFRIDPRPFEVELARARAGLASAQATLERARVQVARFQGLSEQRAVAQSEVEDWETQANVAAAAVEGNRAQIAAAELQLDYTSIESPITGRIGRALKDTGSYVDAGQNGLLAIVQQVDPMYVRYSITEQEVLRFRRQTAAGEIAAPPVDEIGLEVTLADGTTYPHRGRINFIDVQVDESTGTSIVRGEVPNPDGLLKPGQFIHADVLGILRVDVLRVPMTAVSQSPAGASVLVVGAGDVAESRPVTLGEWSGASHWIVTRGLAPGDRVIVDRLMTVRAGMRVTVAEDPPHAREAAPTPAGASDRGARARVNGGPR